MKKIFLPIYAFIVFLNASCQKVDFPQEPNFQEWAASLTYDELDSMSRITNPLLIDLRKGYPESVFLYKDSVIINPPFNQYDPKYTDQEIADAIYPSTALQGVTTVSFQDKTIFKNSWNFYYMAYYRTITRLDYGRCNDFQLLHVSNTSTKTAGSYYLEERLFVNKGKDLTELNLKNMGFCYLIDNFWLCSLRKNTVMIHGFDFIRWNPKYKYFVLLDLETKETYKIAVDYYYE